MNHTGAPTTLFNRPGRFLMLRSIVAAVLVVVIVAGLFGRVVRDRNAALAILFYLPLLPVSLVAVVFDLVLRGRALPHGRFLIAGLGVVGAASSAIPMIGSGAIGKYESTDTEVTLLQWNVLWGGAPFRSERTWAAERAEIANRDPDLIVLTELPRADWLALLVDELGPEANVVGIEHDPHSRYWFRVAVCSRWPLHLGMHMRVPGGVAMSVTCKVRGHAMRLLVVDGKSNPLSSRLPFLEAISELCRSAALEGRPFDAVAGDFNTPGQSIGFDWLAAQGYTLAGCSAPGWRGTFPSFLPIYDIDHVWLRSGLRLRSCTVFTGAASDHRGQFVSMLVNSPAATDDEALR